MPMCKICGGPVTAGVVIHPECLPRWRPVSDTEDLRPFEDLVLTDGVTMSFGTWTNVGGFRDLHNMLMEEPTHWMLSDQLRELLMGQMEGQTPGGQRRGWRTVNNPPKEYEPVLVVVSGRYKGITFQDAVEVGSWAKKDGWILEHYPEWDAPIITHWMPMPQTPGEV